MRIENENMRNEVASFNSLLGFCLLLLGFIITIIPFELIFEGYLLVLVSAFGLSLLCFLRASYIKKLQILYKTPPNLYYAYTIDSVAPAVELDLIKLKLIDKKSGKTYVVYADAGEFAVNPEAGKDVFYDGKQYQFDMKNILSENIDEPHMCDTLETR
jgi:hypothetical protein